MNALIRLLIAICVGAFIFAFYWMFTGSGNKKLYFDPDQSSSEYEEVLRTEHAPSPYSSDNTEPVDASVAIEPESVEELKDLEARDHTSIQQLLNTVVDNQSAEAALVYALSELSGPLRLEASIAIVDAWSQIDVVAVADFVASLLTPDQRALLIAVQENYIKEDPSLALEWSLYDIPAEYRTALSVSAMNTWSQQSLEDAWQWAQNYTSQEQTLTRAGSASIKEVVMQKAYQDFDAAYALVDGLMPERGLPDAASGLLNQWMQVNPSDALKWFSETSERYPEINWDAGYALAAHSTALEFGLDAAVEWVKRIDDPNLYQITLERVLSLSEF